MTRISPRLEWMRPYLALAQKHLPPETRIARIGAWGTGTSRGNGCLAAIFQTRIGEPYRIWIHTSYEFSQIDYLTLLAHELAHTASWRHTPEHARLEAKLKMIFMDQLRKDGYESEEREFAG